MVFYPGHDHETRATFRAPGDRSAEHDLDPAATSTIVDTMAQTLSAVRAAVAGARPSLDDVLSLWPAGQRYRVVLRARLGADGGVSIGAHLREQAVEAQAPDVARDVRRIRSDVPVVLELDEASSVVVPMRTLKARR
jgi:hypothetical protein